MTADEFWDFVHRPENQDRDFELIRGEVVEVSRPTKPRGAVASLVAFELQLYARAVQKGYVVSNDSGIAIADDPDSVLGPDVAYFMDANKFEDMHPKWGDIPPILAVEVSSPNDRPGRTNAKIREYLTNGVKVVWQVDYEERNVTVYRPKQDMEVIGEGGDLIPNPVNEPSATQPAYAGGSTTAARRTASVSWLGYSSAGFGMTGGDDLPGLSIKVADIFKLPGERTASPPPQAPSA